MACTTISRFTALLSILAATADTSAGVRVLKMGSTAALSSGVIVSPVWAYMPNVPIHNMGFVAISGEAGVCSSTAKGTTAALNSSAENLPRRTSSSNAFTWASAVATDARAVDRCMLSVSVVSGCET